jgi:hypothetical protein
MEAVAAAVRRVQRYAIGKGFLAIEEGYQR